MARSCGAKDAEDIVQQMYITLYDNEHKVIDKVVIDGKPNMGYIYYVIRNYIINRNKKPKLIELPINEVIIPDLSENYDEEKEQQLTLVSKSIRKLSHYQSLVYNAYFIHGKSLREIQENTGIHYRSIHNEVKKIKQIVWQEVENQKV